MLRQRLHLRPGTSYDEADQAITAGMARLGMTDTLPQTRAALAAMSSSEGFDADGWQARDAQVDRVQTQGEKVGALSSARRYTEAYAQAKVWTTQKGKVQLKPDIQVWTEGGAGLPEAWSARGVLAIAVGDAADARASFRRALELDHGVNLPPYARAAAQAK